MSQDNSPLKHHVKQVLFTCKTLPLCESGIDIHYLKILLADYIKQLKGFEPFPSPITFSKSDLSPVSQSERCQWQ